MVKGIKRQIDIALSNVQKEITTNSKRGFFSAGLSTEGYAGGYMQALLDVIAALNGVPPSHSRYWLLPNKTKRIP